MSSFQPFRISFFRINFILSFLNYSIKSWPGQTFFILSVWSNLSKAAQKSLIINSIRVSFHQKLFPIDESKAFTNSKIKIVEELSNIQLNLRVSKTLVISTNEWNWIFKGKSDQQQTTLNVQIFIQYLNLFIHKIEKKLILFEN